MARVRMYARAFVDRGIYKWNLPTAVMAWGVLNMRRGLENDMKSNLTLPDGVVLAQRAPYIALARLKLHLNFSGNLSN